MDELMVEAAFIQKKRHKKISSKKVGALEKCS